MGGIGVRVFIVDQGKAIRIPWKRFERLLSGNSGDALPEFAGQRIRYALLYVELVNRRPVAIRYADYSVVVFGPDGRVDQDAWRRGGALVMESIGRRFGAKSRSVVDFGPHLAAHTYSKEFKWVPTQQEVDALLRAALE